jgi:hypothetical protein
MSPYDPVDGNGTEKRMPWAGGPRTQRSRYRRSGIVNIWTVLVGLMVIGMMGLATDVAFIVYSGQQLQNAADAASMAAVYYVREDPDLARAAALRIAGENVAANASVLLRDNADNSPDGDVVIGIFDRETRTFTPSLEDRNAVLVVARRTSQSPGGPLDLLFGPVFGVQTFNAERKAIAMIGGGTGAGLILLDETDKWTFRLSGDVTLDVTDVDNPDGGAIQVNSDNWDAMKIDGTAATLLAGAINVYADEGDPPPPAVYDGPTNFDEPRIPDPLAGLPVPAPGPNQGTVKITGGAHTLNPGFFPDGIVVTGGDVSLAPGIYVLAGEGLQINGGNFTANEVMFYLLADTKKTSVDLGGNAMIQMTALPLEQSPYGGMLLWQSKDNTNDAKISGTDMFEGLDGTLYFPTAHVNVVGTSDSFGIRQLVTNTASISGTGTVTINYDGRNTAPGMAIFLVQ